MAVWPTRTYRACGITLRKSTKYLKKLGCTTHCYNVRIVAYVSVNVLSTLPFIFESLLTVVVLAQNPDHGFTFFFSPIFLRVHIQCAYFL